MTSPPLPAPGLRNWLLICSLGVIWGSAFMCMSIVLQAYSPLTVAALRVVLAAFVMVTLGWAVGQPVTAILRAGFRGVVFVGTIGLVTVTLPFLLLTWGLQHVPSAFAGVAMGAVPLMILPLAYIFSPEEGIGPRRILGVAIGFLGLALLVGPGALEQTSQMTRYGQMACIGAAMCYGIGSIVTRRAPPVPPLAFAAGSMCFGAVLMVPAMLIVDGVPTWVGGFEGWTLLYMAAIPTGIASAIRVSVVQSAGSVFMSLTSYQVPIWAVIFGVVLLGENLPSQIWMAVALILAGMAISQSRALIDLFRSA